MSDVGSVEGAMAALAPLLSGGLAAYRSSFAAPSSATRPGQDGAAFPRGIGGHLERFAATYPEPDPRAVATLWSKHHFAHLIIPAVAADLVLRRRLPVRLADLAVLSDDGGKTIGFTTEGATRPAEGRDLGRFDDLVDHHLRPVVEATSRASRLSARVLWSNVGNLFENAVRTLETLPGVDPDGLAAARSLLGERKRPDGAPNPLREPVRYLGSPPRRLRRVCCLRYLIPSLSLCGTCPLERED